MKARNKPKHRGGLISPSSNVIPALLDEGYVLNKTQIEAVRRSNQTRSKVMLKFNVLYGSWHADGDEFPGGVNEVEDPSAELIKLAGSAHAAGAIEVEEGLDMSHVESDEESREKLEAAMGDWIEPERDADTGMVVAPGHWDGPWAEGHYENAALMVGQSVVEMVVDIEPPEEE